MKQRYLKQCVVGAAVVTAYAWCLPAQAQFGPSPYGQPRNGRTRTTNQAQQNGQDGQGVLPLPKGVTNVISVDAQNTLLVESEDPDNPGQKRYDAIRINHVYSGGIAKLLGGTIIQTETLVSPAYNQQNGNGGFPGPSPYGNNNTNGYNGYGGVNTFNPTGGGFNPFGTNNYNPGSNYPQGNSTYNPNLYNTTPNNPYINNGVRYNRNYFQPPINTRNVQQVLNAFDRTPQQVAVGP